MEIAKDTSVVFNYKINFSRQKVKNAIMKKKSFTLVKLPGIFEATKLEKLNTTDTVKHFKSYFITCTS